jgi:hypothetical protein
MMGMKWMLFFLLLLLLFVFVPLPRRLSGRPGNKKLLLLLMTILMRTPTLARTSKR